MEVLFTIVSIKWILRTNSELVLLLDGTFWEFNTINDIEQHDCDFDQHSARSEAVFAN